MVWIKRNKPPEAHRCDLPLTAPRVAVAEAVADGQPGDLWGCDHCGQVWEVTVHRRWVKASKRAQRKYHPRYTCGCRIGRPQRGICRDRPAGRRHGNLPPTATPVPPRGGGGVARKYPSLKPTRTTSEIANDMSTEE